MLQVTVVEGRALVGELANERTTSSALYNFSVDLQFNAQVISSVCLAACLLSVRPYVCLQNAFMYRTVFPRLPTARYNCAR